MSFILINVLTQINEY